MSESNQGSCPQAGEFGWNELVSSDTAASAEFYAQLFGWRAEPHSPKGHPLGSPPYTLFKIGDNMIAGMVKPSIDSPTFWLPYVVVENLEESVAKAQQLNAEMILPIMDIGEVGRIAVVKDPRGAVIGFHEFPKSK